MGYRLVSISYGRGWKIRFESRKGGMRTTTTIKPEEFSRLGFYDSMAADDAKSRIRVLNSSYRTLELEKSRQVIQSRLSQERDSLALVLPAPLLEEFEGKMRLLRVNKWKSHWRAAQRMLVALEAFRPTEWILNTEQFYDYFIQKTWSLSYTQKVLYITNAWGKFYSRTLAQYFESIPNPTGVFKQRIADAAFESKGTQESQPLSPEQLESIKSSIAETSHNWLYLSVWLGLRPGEVDLLRKPSSPQTWYVTSPGQYQALHIYQSKLITISRAKRYKAIPLITKEQESVIKIILSGEFRRPLCKTLQSYLGPGYNCYAGRKGFVSLMLRYGYTFEKISRWMGHQSIDRTWKSYTDKTKDLF